jgi:hypothetical protein
LELGKEIEVPASSFVKKDVGASAQNVIKAAEEVQELVKTKAWSLLAGIQGEETSSVGELVKSTEGVQEKASCSEADASEAAKGNTDSLNTANVIEVESNSTSSSPSTSVSTSSDIDDIR